MNIIVLYVCIAGMVNGVTYLDSVMYVVCDKSSCIDVFSANTFTPVNEGILVEGMKNPTDIVVCRHGRQLYVPDSGEFIWAVSVDVHSPVKWLPTESMSGTLDITSLSLTSQHLLVTSQRRKLYLWSTTDKHLLREVPLPGHMTRVQHAAETTRDTFVVCHQGTSEDSKRHAVSH